MHLKSAPPNSARGRVRGMREETRGVLGLRPRLALPFQQNFPRYKRTGLEVRRFHFEFLTQSGNFRAPLALSGPGRHSIRVLGRFRPFSEARAIVD